jgi:hypothetical protein
MRLEAIAGTNPLVGPVCRCTRWGMLVVIAAFVRGLATEELQQKHALPGPSLI